MKKKTAISRRHTDSIELGKTTNLGSHYCNNDIDWRLPRDNGATGAVTI